MVRRTSADTEKHMRPRLRKLALTAHVTLSLGWFGAVAAFLALAIAGVTTKDAQLVRAVYLAMEWITWSVIVPFAVASLATGIVESLGTPWGLFRHYWVLAKFILTSLATLLLLLHTQPIGWLAAAAREVTWSTADLQRIQMKLVVDAVLALVVLLVTTALAVYKPRGVTPYGRRKQQEQRAASQALEPS